jgi:UDP-N-acetylglucosamine acyltransferase
MTAEIHPSSFIAKGAKIGNGVKIGPFCSISENVEIGDNTTLISHVVIDGHTKLGSGNTIYPHVAIGLAPQDLSYKGEPTRVEIGDNNTIREGVTIHRATLKENQLTKIGNNNYLMCYVHVAHDVILENNCIITNSVNFAGHVRIGDNCIIGGGTNISQFCKLGRGAYIGGGSGIDKDIPPFCTALGNRIKLKGINIIGMKRRGIPKAEISEMVEFFRLMEASSLSPKAFLEKSPVVSEYMSNSYILELSKFITESEIGIAPFNY